MPANKKELVEIVAINIDSVDKVVKSKNDKSTPIQILNNKFPDLVDSQVKILLQEHYEYIYNDLLNIRMVYDKFKKSMFIYINGKMELYKKEHTLKVRNELKKVFFREQKFKSVYSLEEVTQSLLLYGMEHSSNLLDDYFKSLEVKQISINPFTELSKYIKDSNNTFCEYLEASMYLAYKRFKEQATTTGVRVPVLLLGGSQEIGKSYFVRWIGQPFNDIYSNCTSAVTEIDCLIISDDLKRSLCSHILMEVGEITEGNNSSNSKVKQLITAHYFPYRSLYENQIDNHINLALLVGTFNPNNAHMFTDHENTRFLTCVFDDKSIFNHEYSKVIDPKDLWLKVINDYNNDPSKKLYNIIDKDKQAETNAGFQKLSDYDQLLNRCLIIDQEGKQKPINSQMIVNILMTRQKNDDDKLLNEFNRLLVGKRKAHLERFLKTNRIMLDQRHRSKIGYSDTEVKSCTYKVGFNSSHIRDTDLIDHL